jgi:hypothetical protein
LGTFVGWLSEFLKRRFPVLQVFAYPAFLKCGHDSLLPNIFFRKKIMEKSLEQKFISHNGRNFHIGIPF